MATATSRVVILMPPDEKEDLVQRARAAGLSVAEYIRRSVLAARDDAFVETELQGRQHEVERLLEELERSNQEAMQALLEAKAELRASLARLDRAEAGHVAG